jgi:hypothetical protein
LRRTTRYSWVIGPSKPERSDGESALQRFNGPCANRPVSEAQAPAEFGQYPVRLDALAPDDVVGDDVNCMATGLERLLAMAEGSLQIGVESAQTPGDGPFLADR